jgi:hypothetical protein
MEEMLCAMALKSTNGRLNHHTPSGRLLLSGERALQSAGERNTHNQRRFGGVFFSPCWQIAVR